MVILDMNKYSQILPIFRVNYFDPIANSWNLNSSPSLVIIDRDGRVQEKVLGRGVLSDRAEFTNILTNYTTRYQSGADTNQTLSLGGEHTAETATTRTTTMYRDTEEQVLEVKDEVFMSDLEKAVQYSVVKEAGMQPYLDEEKIQSLIKYIQALISFFPHMRVSIRNFLTPLYNWLIEKQYLNVTSTKYNQKLEFLLKHHQPFSGTPANWAGCAGSQSKYRGYPCSLWTLFHTLTVNAADKDPAFQYGDDSSVAKAMVGYIRDFFSCQDCAEHFSSHVNKLEALPKTAEQSVLWLWKVHNMANSMLAGDPTEDPKRPKVQWPSKANCPECRSEETSDGGKYVEVNGVVWDKEEVLSYINKVYKRKNIVKNVDNIKDSDTSESDDSVTNFEINNGIDNISNSVTDFEINNDVEKTPNHSAASVWANTFTINLLIIVSQLTFIILQ